MFFPMVTREIFRYGWIALLSICLSPCNAQNAADVVLKFVSFPKSAEPVNMKLAVGDGKLIDITAQSNWLSEPVRVPAMEHWVVGDMAVGPDGKAVFKESGRAKSLSSPSQVIVLVRKGKADSKSFDVIPLDAGDAGFGKGSFLFMSAARVDIGGMVGDKKFVIKPGGHAIIKPGGASGEPMMKTVFIYRQGDESKPFFSSRWPVSDVARSLVFFYHDPENSQLRFHTIRDFPSP